MVEEKPGQCGLGGVLPTGPGMEILPIVGYFIFLVDVGMVIFPVVRYYIFLADVSMAILPIVGYYIVWQMRVW